MTNTDIKQETRRETDHASLTGVGTPRARGAYKGIPVSLSLQQAYFDQLGEVANVLVLWQDS